MLEAKDKPATIGAKPANEMITPAPVLDANTEKLLIIGAIAALAIYVFKGAK